MEPYRVVYYGGFWYLIGNEPATGILKRYALDKIKDLRLMTSRFKSIPGDLDSVLKGSANIWFSGEKNKEERPDGSLVVTFRVGHYDAIRHILKSWIPHMIILEPEEFQLSLIEDVRGWLKRQTKMDFSLRSK